MRAGGVVSLKRINFIGILAKNKLILLMFSVFLIGFFISSISFSESKAAQISDSIFKVFISDRQGASFFKIIFPVLIKYLIVYLAIFLAGASVAGVVFVPLLCCCLGLYYGILTSYAYVTFSIRGIAFNSVVIIPGALIFTFCVLFASKESFRFSSVMLRLLLPKSRQVNMSGEFRIYTGKFLLFSLFTLLASLADAVVSVSFLDYFTFI